MSGSVGWMRTRVMWCASSRPIWRHVRPASSERHMPSPWPTLPRTVFSPPPTYTTFGSHSLTATAPMEPPKKPSVTLDQDSPWSSLFHTPPPAAPM